MKTNHNLIPKYFTSDSNEIIFHESNLYCTVPTYFYEITKRLLFSFYVKKCAVVSTANLLKTILEQTIKSIVQSNTLSRIAQFKRTPRYKVANRVQEKKKGLMLVILM